MARMKRAQKIAAPPIPVEQSGLVAPVDRVDTSRARKPPPPKGWQDRFFEQLGETGIVSLAASRAGVTRARVYKLLETSPPFKARWDAAQKLAVGTLLDAATSRALSASDHLLRWLIEKRAPEQYGPTLSVTQTGTLNATVHHEGKVDIGSMTQDDLIRFYAEQVQVPAERAASVGATAEEPGVLDGDGSGQGSSEG